MQVDGVSSVKPHLQVRLGSDARGVRYMRIVGRPLAIICHCSKLQQWIDIDTQCDIPTPQSAQARIKEHDGWKLGTCMCERRTR